MNTEKLLQLLKEKNVSIKRLRTEDSLKYYNAYLPVEDQLTQEEYNELLNWIKNK